MNIKDFILECIKEEKEKETWLETPTRVTEEMLSLHEVKDSICSKCNESWPCSSLVEMSKVYKDHSKYSCEWDKE